MQLKLAVSESILQYGHSGTECFGLGNGLQVWQAEDQADIPAKERF